MNESGVAFAPAIPQNAPLVVRCTGGTRVLAVVMFLGVGLEVLLLDAVMRALRSESGTPPRLTFDWSSEVK